MLLSVGVNCILTPSPAQLDRGVESPALNLILGLCFSKERLTLFSAVRFSF